MTFILMDMDIFLNIIVVTALVISVVEDLRRQKIPNVVTFPTMAVAVAFHSLSAGMNGFLYSAGGLALGMGLFMIPYILGGMGAGDVKLMGACGAVFGPKGIIAALILVVLAGGLYGLIIVAFHPRYVASLLKRLWEMVKTIAVTFQFTQLPQDNNGKLPVLKFAIPIALGAFVYMWMNITGYDLFPIVLGDNFKILSIAFPQGGTG
jgi:prepilin peptidase CpaA